MAAADFEALLSQLVAQQCDRSQQSRAAIEGLAEECREQHRKLGKMRGVQGQAMCAALRGSQRPELPQMPNAIDLYEMSLEHQGCRIQSPVGGKQSVAGEGIVQGRTVQEQADLEAGVEEKECLQRLRSILAKGGAAPRLPMAIPDEVPAPKSPPEPARKVAMDRWRAACGAAALKPPPQAVENRPSPPPPAGEPPPVHGRTPMSEVPSTSGRPRIVRMGDAEWQSPPPKTAQFPDARGFGRSESVAMCAQHSEVRHTDSGHQLPSRMRRAAFAGASPVAHTEIKGVDKHRDRLVDLLHLDPEAQTVCAQEVCKLLEERGTTLDDLDPALITHLFTSVHRSTEEEGSLFQEYFADMEFDVEAMHGDTLPLQAFVLLVTQPVYQYSLEEPAQTTATTLSTVMMATTLSDIVRNATKFAFSEDRLHLKGSTHWETTLSIFVFCTTILSLCIVGTSLDWHEDNQAWKVLEGCCCAVFVVEIGVRMRIMGVGIYFSDPKSKGWNIADVIVTGISILEWIVSIWVQFQGNLGRFQNLVGLLRMMFIFRVLRLVKLFRSRVGKEVANIILCCSIGAYSLASVLGIFIMVLFLLGLLGRVFLGPAPGQDVMSRCGDPDDMGSWEDTVCPVHHMYGEVYFNSVKTGMFSTFRFMMGDFSSVNDRNVILAFSKGYGSVFDVMFVSGMLAVYFGLFNIITAVFVESTIAGLKHSDAKRKQAQHYEKQFVKDKLGLLVQEITSLSHSLGTRSSKFPRSTRSRLSVFSDKRLNASSDIRDYAVDDVVLNQASFVKIVNDPIVTNILRDLDITVLNPSTIFDTLDPASTGFVTLPDTIGGFMKLRGEPSKNDLIANLQAIMSLHEKVDRLEQCMRPNVS